jgi:hypothetical protein
MRPIHVAHLDEARAALVVAREIVRPHRVLIDHQERELSEAIHAVFDLG